MTTRFLLSYDLDGAEDSEHTAFKTELEGHGWDRCITMSGSRKKLPETTMVGKFKDQDAADKSVRTSAKSTRVIIGKYITVAIAATGIKGQLNEECEA